MRNKLRILALLLGLIFALIVLFCALISIRGIPTYEVNLVDHTVITTPQSLARGEKLTRSLCASCHADSKTGKLTGTEMLDAPKEFGRIFSQNITNDKTWGIGDWTDEELIYLLRTGIKRDGKYAPPYMAKLPTMADEDIDAIISFLRSDHEMVAADPTPDQPVEPSFLTKLLSTVAWKPFPMPTAPIQMPDTSDKIELGRYLAHNLDCFSCHSADFKTNNFLMPEKSAGYFGGGNKTLNKKGQLILSANLTPHPEHGIGSWTEKQFIEALRYGRKSGELGLRYPMLSYPQLTDEEAGAIFAYLKTIPPIDHKIDRNTAD